MILKILATYFLNWSRLKHCMMFCRSATATFVSFSVRTWWSKPLFEFHPVDREFERDPNPRIVLVELERRVKWSICFLQRWESKTCLCLSRSACAWIFQTHSGTLRTEHFLLYYIMRHWVTAQEFKVTVSRIITDGHLAQEDFVRRWFSSLYQWICPTKNWNFWNSQD